MRHINQHRVAQRPAVDQQDRPDGNAFSLFNKSNNIDYGS